MVHWDELKIFIETPIYSIQNKMTLLHFIISFAVGVQYWHLNKRRSQLSWTRMLNFGHRGARVLARLWIEPVSLQQQPRGSCWVPVRPPRRIPSIDGLLCLCK